MQQTARQLLRLWPGHDTRSNATVTVTLNGVTYTTVADENGFYTLDIATATVSELVTSKPPRR